MADDRTGWSAVTRRQSLGLAAGGLAAAAAPAAAARAPRRRDWSSLDRMAQQAVARRLMPGMQLSVMERGALVYSEAFGAANLETGTPLTPASVMRIASITKQFTAAAVLKLQEDGRLSVDDRLSRFVPEFGVPAEQVTLRQMLSHVSGLAVGPAGSPLLRRGTDTSDYDTASMVATLVARGPMLRTPPGTRWDYNNVAYRLLTVAVERASGLRFAELFKARLFDPARLTHTAVDDGAHVVPGRASGYEIDTAAASGFRNAPPLSMSWTSGAGSMRSTTDDLCRWHEALLGGRILRPESLAAMLTPVRLADGSLPPRPAEAGSAEPLRYGFGIRTETYDGRRAVTHIGAIEGFAAELTSYPDARVTVAGLVNSGPAAGNANAQALGATLREAARIALS